MGFGTYVPTEIYFSHKTYDSLYDLELDRDEAKEMMQDIESTLVLYCGMTPKDIVGKDIEGVELDPEFVVQKIKRLMKEYREYTVEVAKLDELERNWDKRHGDFINLTKEDIK